MVLEAAPSAPVRPSLTEPPSLGNFLPKGLPMKKPVLMIEEPQPKKALRADRPPTEGFVTVVDGHFKSEFDTVEAAEAAGRTLKAAYPMLQIEIYDAEKKVRTLLT
jgi:hypothetical protein